VIHTAADHRLVITHPRDLVLEQIGTGVTETHSALFLGGHHAGILQEPHVLLDAREGHIELLGELGDGGRLGAQLLQNAPPRAVGKSREACVEINILNHMVQYYSGPFPVSTLVAKLPSMATVSAHPLVSFTDLDKGLALLKDVFGLTEHAVFRDDNGVIQHCEVRYGDTIVMPAERNDSYWSLGPVSLYLSTDEPDALHDKAVAAGLEIVMPLTDQEYGSRDFGAKDFSGNVWIFGTYRPEEKPS
jgi:uncharacterized glyoxalase superfamily protein PhnB